MQNLKILWSGIIILLLSACNFQLDSQTKPFLLSLNSIYIYTSDPYDPLIKKIARDLQDEGVQLSSRAEAKYILEIFNQKQSTTVFNVGIISQVSNARITYSMDYKLLNAKGKVLIPVHTISSSRNFSTNPNQVVSDNYAKNLLIIDMIQDMGYQLLIQLHTLLKAQSHSFKTA